jgi:hypothetical protein
MSVLVYGIAPFVPYGKATELFRLLLNLNVYGIFHRIFKRRSNEGVCRGAVCSTHDRDEKYIKGKPRRKISFGRPVWKTRELDLKEADFEGVYRINLAQGKA